MGRKKVVRVVDSTIETKKTLFHRTAKASDWVNLSFDELEALRLCDIKGLYQDEAAKRMDVSRATFARILFEARRKTAQAIINGFPVKLSKGNVKFENEKINCPIHKTKKRKGRICLCKEEKGRQNA
jgi:predicted DNA-binding protein (UPF0251 family)